MTKTAKSVAQRTGMSERLIRGVLRQLGGGAEAWLSLGDVYRHGAYGGFPGFIYYRDTVGFFQRYRKEIAELAERQADDLGVTAGEMVFGFRCLAGSMDAAPLGNGDHNRARREAIAAYIPSITRCLYGGRMTDDDDNVANALAWFALEEVARAAFED